MEEQEQGDRKMSKIDELIKMFHLEKLPDHMRQETAEYLGYGCPPGGFLRACLEDQLVRSYSRADHINIRSMHVWADWLYNYCPCQARGSKEAVDGWIKKKGLYGVDQRMSKADEPEQQESQR